MWSAQSYAAVCRCFPPGSRRLQALRMVDVAAPLPMYLAYPCLLAALWRAQDARLARTALVPAAVFILCTLLRAWLRWPRPCRVEGLTPLFEQAADHRPDHSFPSRHAASAVIIALAAGSINAHIGWALGALALLICTTRVLGGLHHPRDAAAGALLALAVGVPLLFWL